MTFATPDSPFGFLEKQKVTAVLGGTAANSISLFSGQ
jgi:hypothetical protein